ncbi:hypothetical protein Bra3105_06620 [Brachybacterium halotolerans subsp. kimchii]|uniref:hypothetical protein n=1 Tax=Brachybacterium halotolerans TaxID=2795215 RepID=UPI001E64B79B|nr:hypothetical protein [Brachybacterium halotolerans]UEJ83980.1 hypothetical protein Bra3105_06620 [Brachybacterium halotolerans subsp. kimchii]
MSTSTTEDFLNQLEACAAEVEEAQKDLDAARQDRDEQIRAAITHGVTMYAIAKRTGLTQQAVAKIRDRGGDE